MEIYKIIKARRQELGLTLKDVASALGIAESTVSRYESKDIKNMGIDKIEDLARVLNCSPGYLMGWDSEEELGTLLADVYEDNDLQACIKELQTLSPKDRKSAYDFVHFLSLNKKQ